MLAYQRTGWLTISTGKGLRLDWAARRRIAARHAPLQSATWSRRAL